MRPHRLRVQGLATFVDLVEIDFNGLDLFAITGPTGAGKTSLLTAMTAALYGRAPEVADDLRQLISTGSMEAKIFFEFGAGGRRYRAQRAIHRTRNAEVRLEVWEAEGWKSLIRGSRQGRGEIEKILGLSYEAFTKVVLLPQGQVAQFLRGQGRDRRKIMIDLLGLEIYQRIQQGANAEASAAQAQGDTLERMLDKDYADASPERLDQVRGALANAGKQLASLNETLALVDGAVEAARREQAQAEIRARAEADAATARATISQTETEFAHASTLVQRLTGEVSSLDRDIASVAYDPARHAALQRSEIEAKRLMTIRDRVAQLEREQREGDRQQQTLASQSAELHQILVGARRELDAEEARRALVREALAGIEREVGPRVEVARLRERARQYAADLQALATAQVDRQAVEDEIRTLAGRVEQFAEAEQRMQQALARAEQEEGERQAALRARRTTAELAARAARDLSEAREHHDQAELAHAAAAREATAQADAVAAARTVFHGAEAAERAAGASLDVERERHMAHVLRQGLAPGDACPVCARPIDAVPDRHAPLLETAEASLEHARAARTVAEDRLHAARDAAARTEERARTAERELESAWAAVAAAEATLSTALPDEVRDQGDWPNALERSVERAAHQAQQAGVVVRQRRGAVKEATASLLRARAQHDTLGRTLQDRIQAVDGLTARCAEAAVVLGRAIARARSRDLDAFLAEIEGRLLEAERAGEAAARAFDAARQRALDTDQAWQRTATALAHERENAEHRQAERDRSRAEGETLEASLGKALGTTDAAMLAALPSQIEALAAAKDVLYTLATRRDEIEGHLRQARESVAQGRGNLESARQHGRECQARFEQAHESWTAARRALDDAAVAAGLDPQDAALDPLMKHRAQLATDRDEALHAQSSLAADERAVIERIARAASLREELGDARRKAAVARELGQLLGGQQLQNWLLADAMRLLVEDASAHLERLTDHRYRLQVTDLDFEVMDRWNADAVRSVKTLSGGETFLAALAVALALADRVAGRAEAAHGQHPLESLFIDEGFGTLDAGETLENVAEALEQLQATHRVIGVITHLPQLADRLPAQIRVIKDMGRSRVELIAS